MKPEHFINIIFQAYLTLDPILVSHLTKSFVIPLLATTFAENRLTY